MLQEVAILIRHRNCGKCFESLIHSIFMFSVGQGCNYLQKTQLIVWFEPSTLTTCLQVNFLQQRIIFNLRLHNELNLAAAFSISTNGKIGRIPQLVL